MYSAPSRIIPLSGTAGDPGKVLHPADAIALLLCHVQAPLEDPATQRSLSSFPAATTANPLFLRLHSFSTMAASRTLLCALLAAACLSAAMASTENAVARKLASHRQLNGFKPIPIDASIILLFLSDVEGGDNSPCVAMVNRAMEFKGRSINFFVTAYYADDNGDSRVDRIGWKKSDNDKSFREMDLNYVEQYKKGLQVSSSALMTRTLGKPGRHARIRNVPCQPVRRLGGWVGGGYPAPATAHSSALAAAHEHRADPHSPACHLPVTSLHV